MPIIICIRCGYKTNTACSDHINRSDGKADGCYARYYQGEWERGCLYKTASKFSKTFANKIIGIE